MIYCDYSARWTPDAVSEVMTYYQEFAFPLSVRQHAPWIFLNYFTSNISEDDWSAIEEDCGIEAFLVKNLDCFKVWLVNLSKDDSSDHLSWLPEQLRELELASSGTLIIQSWLSPNP